MSPPSVSSMTRKFVVKPRPLRLTLGCCYSWWPLTSCRSFSDVETQSACRRSWQLEPGPTKSISMTWFVHAGQLKLDLSWVFLCHGFCGLYSSSVWILVVALVLVYHLRSLAAVIALELCNTFVAEDFVALRRRCRLTMLLFEEIEAQHSYSGIYTADLSTRCSQRFGQEKTERAREGDGEVCRSRFGWHPGELCSRHQSRSSWTQLHCLTISWSWKFWCGHILETFAWWQASDCQAVLRGTAKFEDALMIELLTYSALHNHPGDQLFAHAFMMWAWPKSDWMRMICSVKHACTCCCCCCCWIYNPRYWCCGFPLLAVSLH